MVAYVGLDPQPHERGVSVWRPALISRQGDRGLRARLYLGALGALRGDNSVHAFYQRLVDRGKPKKESGFGCGCTQAAGLGVGGVYLGPDV